MAKAGDAFDYINDNIQKRPLLRFALIGLDIATGPIAFAARTAIMKSPLGDKIVENIGKASGKLGGMLTDAGIDTSLAIRATKGVMGIVGLGLLGRGVIKYWPQIKSGLSNLKNITRAMFRDESGGAGLPSIRRKRKNNEIIKSFSSFNDARAQAIKSAKLGDGAVHFTQKIGPHKGRITGSQSPDGSRGWRIDFDPNDVDKALHVNWWTNKLAGSKRSTWQYGANIVKNGTQDDFYRILSHFPDS